MKKYILKLTLALAVVVAVGYTVYSSQASSEIASATLDNVEALASGEGGGIKLCYGVGTTYCPYNGFWVNRVE